MGFDKFINKIKDLLLPLRQHGFNLFESKSKVKRGNQNVAATFWFDKPKCSRYILVALLLVGCGSANETSNINASVATQLPPVITRVTPTSGRAGDSITIFGFGFSSAAASNIINVGGQAVAASSYALLNPPAAGEIESLTFAVPSGATTGVSGIFVTVFELTSNADVQFTVNP